MKKPLFTEKQSKILTIVMTVIQILIVLVAIIFASIILANPNVKSGEVGSGNVKLLPVLTNSMAGDNKDSFNEGDLVIAKTPKDKNALKVGDIVTYVMDMGESKQLNTHRIVDVKVVDGQTCYTTRGDNAGGDDPFIYADEVLAVYSTHLKGVGSAIQWLQDPTHFLLVIVVPLILLFIYNIVMFVRMLLIAKFSKLQEAGGAPVDEAEIRKKAIEEYLAAQNAAKQSDGGSSADEKGEDDKE